MQLLFTKLDETGDTPTTFELNDATAIDDAMKAFHDIVSTHRHLAYRRTASDQKSNLTAFTPEQGATQEVNRQKFLDHIGRDTVEIVFHPVVIGG